MLTVTPTTFTGHPGPNYTTLAFTLPDVYGDYVAYGTELSLAWARAIQIRFKPSGFTALTSLSLLTEARTEGGGNSLSQNLGSPQGSPRGSFVVPSDGTEKEVAQMQPFQHIPYVSDCAGSVWAWTMPCPSRTGCPARLVFYSIFAIISKTTDQALRSTQSLLFRSSMSAEPLPAGLAPRTDDAIPPSKNALGALGEAIHGCRAAITCGGTIPINTQSDRSLELGTEPIASPPVMIRWGSGDAGFFEKGNAIQFPVKAAAGDEPHQNFQLEKLFQDCEPATFGIGGKDVLDESYRKAAKMDNTRFSTNFHPHDYGIIDAIAQVLLPEVKLAKSEENVSEHLGVVAELYKLNIYSGTSGKFKAHVDTPRGATQFGSLVVCLPYPHEGGQLAVRHKDLETIYDWSNTGTNEIAWAAFYSDCEHEVFEVKSGHRITLTYNLYVSQRVGGTIERLPAVDPAKYAVYQMAEDLLMDPEFMKEGGTLGIYCAHQYAHTTSNASRRLPSALKGDDLVVYTTFRALGLRVEMHPIMDLSEDVMYYRSCREKGEDEDEDDYGGDFVGRSHHKLVTSDRVDYDGDDPSFWAIHEEWPCDRVPGIVWLNKPSSRETAWVRPVVGPTNLPLPHLYGNECSIMWYYSSAAILITFPDSKKRTTAKTGDSSEGEGSG
ncbi:hypothetical protein FGG08_007556 [Glutinoglossum americanum]|uniref:Fe2OG dioxygenase domain-containing protein n=1 Tax=Glutinoglossum americanum TaxID=1670608 RepID=A0A9P8HZ03_9PEZI|nr:hypothetical protein FGG08_007556 [Glutinoglossum americanum]